MKLKISDFCLIVPDVDRAAAFYEEIFDLHPRHREENFADFDLGSGARLAIWGHPSASETVGEEAVGNQGNRFMGAIRYQTGEEVDGAYNSLKNKGVNFIKEPFDWSWGARAAYFADPDGYVWEIYAWTDTPRTLTEEL
jgi:uncharacterized protein